MLNVYRNDYKLFKIFISLLIFFFLYFSCIDYDGVNHQAILKKVDLPVVRHDVCEDRLRLSSLGKNFNLHNSFICAGGINGKDTCRVNFFFFFFLFSVLKSRLCLFNMYQINLKN